MKKILSFLLACIMTLGLCTTAFAAPQGVLPDSDKDGQASLTIYKYEVKDPATIDGIGNDPTGEAGQTVPEGAIPVEDVGFTIQRTENMDGTAATDAALAEIKTDAEGKVEFSNLAFGKYHVWESTTPENLSSEPLDFYVDIPLTKRDGTGWIYDVVLYPKNETTYGSAVLTKYGDDGTTLLAGATFKLQKNTNADGTGTWEDVTTIGGQALVLTTNANGVIVINDMPKGKYQLIETGVPVTDPEYALHNKPIEFEIKGAGKANTSTGATEGGTPVRVTKTNYYKPDIDKTIDLTDPTYKVGDKITWTIETTVPKNIKDYTEYYITDTLDSRLSYENGSVTVQGVKRDGTGTVDVETRPTTTFDEGNKVLSIKFIDNDNSEGIIGNPDELALYEKLIITFDTTIMSLGDKPLDNKASLDFNNGFGTDETIDSGDPDPTNPTDPQIKEAGDVTIVKVDKENNEIKLPNAEFKLYATEKDALAGTNASDIAIKTDSNGQFVLQNLVYSGTERTLWLVETKAPEGYKLLNKPVEITINGEAQTVTIENVKSTLWDDLMPQTGGAGTTWYYVVGAMLVICGALFIALSRKKRQ